MFIQKLESRSNSAQEWNESLQQLDKLQGGDILVELYKDIEKHDKAIQTDAIQTDTVCS